MATDAPAKPQQYPKNHILFKEGDAAPDFYVLLSGKLAVFRHRKFVRAISGAGHFIGEMATLLGQKRSATIITIEPSALITIPKSTEEVFLHRPEIGDKLLESLRRRLSESYDKAEKLWARVMQEIGEMIIYEIATKKAAGRKLTFDQVESEKTAARKIVGQTLRSEDFKFNDLDEFLRSVDVIDEFHRNIREKYPRFKYLELERTKELWKKRVPDGTAEKRRHCVDLAQGLDELTDFLTSFGASGDDSGSEEIDLMETSIPLDRRIALLKSVTQRVLTPKEGIDSMKRINRDIDTEVDEATRHESRTGRIYFLWEFTKRLGVQSTYADELRREYWDACHQPK